jgi:hypothetical protein
MAVNQMKQAVYITGIIFQGQLKILASWRLRNYLDARMSPDKSLKSVNR